MNISAPFSNLTSNAYGILWMLLAGLFFSGMVATVKLLGSTFPSVEIVFFRSIFQLGVMIIVFWRIGFSSLKPNRPFLVGARALLAAVLINCNFYAFTKLPIADAISIGFSRNLFVVVLAVLILGERLTKHRLFVTIVGFLGILIIVRPGSGILEVYAVVALIGAFLGAFMTILVRKLTATDSNFVMMIYPSITIFIATSIPAMLMWVTPTMEELCLLTLSAFFGVVGQWCMIQAFRKGEAIVVSPVMYVRLIFATAFGFYLFSEIPDKFAVLGALTIVGSNLYLIIKEGKGRVEEKVLRVPSDGT